MNSFSKKASFTQEGSPDTELSPRVVVKDLFKTFRRESGEVVPATDNVSLNIFPGEFVVLLGPSGCGKTTLLRQIAGLETPDSGNITIDGIPVFDSASRTNIPPERRPISMVFQSYALWPHMTAFQNIAYPLKSRGVKRQKIAERVRTVMDAMRISELAGQYPNRMSGGQQQRTALARALVANDGTILFDEPLSNIDAKVRESLRLEILARQRDLGFTAVYVTHDQEEALTLATRIVILDRGKIVQVGTPPVIYEKPANLYAANFVGTMNQVPATVIGVSPQQVTVRSDMGEFSVATDDRYQIGDQVHLVSRPERWRLVHEPSTNHPNLLSGTVTQRLYKGTHYVYSLQVNNTSLLIQCGYDEQFDLHQQLQFRIAPTDLHLFPIGNTALPR